jgi:hypothetical protein
VPTGSPVVVAAPELCISLAPDRSAKSPPSGSRRRWPRRSAPRRIHEHRLSVVDRRISYFQPGRRPAPALSHRRTAAEALRSR